MIMDPLLIGGQQRHDEVSLYFCIRSILFNIIYLTPATQPLIMQASQHTVVPKPMRVDQLFMANWNVAHLDQHTRHGVNTKQMMRVFVDEMDINAYSIQGDPSEALAFLNQLFLRAYGNVWGDEIKVVPSESSGHRYPKAVVSEALPNCNSVDDMRSYDAQFDQRTFVTNRVHRYGNRIMPWMQAGHRNRHYTENDGLRLGTQAEKTGMIRGFAMETVLATNRYDTKPEYRAPRQRYGMSVTTDDAPYYILQHGQQNNNQRP